MALSQAGSQNEIAWGLANAERIMIDKASIATQIAGGVCSLWRATGIPGQGAVPAAWAICANGLAGSMGFTNRVAPVKNYIAYAWALTQNAGYAPLIHDRLGHMGGLSGVVATAQTVNADISVATSNLPERIGGSNYSDVNWWLEWYTATGTTAVTATVNVTYNDDTTGNVSVAIPASTGASRAIPIISAVAGKFIKRVNTVTCPTTGVAGSYGVTATRERAVMPTDNIAFKRREFTWAQLGISEIHNDSCLFPMVDTITTSSGIIRSQAKLISV